MNLDIESLESGIKKKVIFKYKPQFSESFTTDIKDSQVIPLNLEVFEKLEWIIVYEDDKSVEAKRKNGWGQFTEKITVTKKASGRVEVHSKTLEGKLTDYGRNSLRTGLFIAAFRKLAAEYQASGELVALETAFERKNSWADYKIPDELPKPKKLREPSLTFSMIGGLVIGILFGILIATLTINFSYYIILYEIGIGMGVGYLFGQVLKKANYIDFKPIQIMIIAIMLVLFVTNQFAQYQLIIAKNDITGLGFLKFMELKIENGLVLDEMDLGWIGLVVSWIVQIVFPYYLAIAQSSGIIAKHMIEKIPEEVQEFALYLLNQEKSESEIRAELAKRGWTQKSDQDEVFQALGEIIGFHEMHRE